MSSEQNGSEPTSPDEEGAGWKGTDFWPKRALYRRLRADPLYEASEGEQRAALGLSASPAMRKLVAGILDNFEQFEADRRRDIRRSIEYNDGLLAGDVAEAYPHPPAESMLTLAEVGRIRRAAKVAEAALPNVVVEADADGMSVAEITAELGIGESYAYRILRERVLCSYRVDVFEAGEWHDREEGEEIIESAQENEVDLAQRLVREHTGFGERHLRITVWKGRPAEGDAPLYTHEHQPTD